MNEEKIPVAISSRHQFFCSGADTRMFTAAPRIVNVKHFGTETGLQEILFRKDMKVALFSGDFEIYFFLPEKATKV